MKRILMIAAIVAALAALLATGCRTLTDIGEQAGVLTPEEAAAIRRTSEAAKLTYEDLPPEQEYYIGRGVAAHILAQYTPYDNPRANEYVNLLGQSLALFSDKPETFGGYRFLLLDTDEINAFAAPGGLILITRGMARLCRNEEELAAVLAHEIGHIQHEHGLRAIRSARLTNAFMIVAAESALHFGSDSLRNFTEEFEGVISDITHTLTTAGYSRQLEREADAASMAILTRSGYDPRAMISMLEQMSIHLNPEGPGYARTHPHPGERILYLREMLDQNIQAPKASAAREARFRAAMQGI